MNRRRTSITLLFIWFALFASAQSKEPFAATWLLSRGKSEFEPPQNFFKRTIILEAVENGYKFVTRTISDRQQTSESSYTAKLDGKDVPINNSPLDTISLKRADSGTLEATAKIKGQVIETATWKLSADGKVLTIVTTGSMNGEDYTSTQVLNRQ